MSIGLGIAIGAAYGLSACVSNFYALRYADQSFLAIVFGGMLIRMVLMLVVVALCAWLLPLELFPFTVALVGTLLISIFAEVSFIWLHSIKRPHSS